jgi:uncharacterized membrane protein
MRKSKRNFIVAGFLGLLAGSILLHMLDGISGLAILTKSVTMAWSPAADLDVLRYQFDIHVKLSVLHLVGVLGALWVVKKL